MNCGPTVAVADLDVSMQGALMSEKIRLGCFCAIVREAIVPFCGWWSKCFDVSAARVVRGSALARAMWAEELR